MTPSQSTHDSKRSGTTMTAAIYGSRLNYYGRRYSTADETSMQGALHFDDGKEGVDQIPPGVLLGLGAVYSYGELKYGRDNWKEGMTWSKVYGSAMRHLLKWWMGQDFDVCPTNHPKGKCAGGDAEFCPTHSRQHHLHQVMWNATTLWWYQAYGKGEDNR